MEIFDQHKLQHQVLNMGWSKFRMITFEGNIIFPRAVYEPTKKFEFSGCSFNQLQFDNVAIASLVFENCIFETLTFGINTNSIVVLNDCTIKFLSVNDSSISVTITKGKIESMASQGKQVSIKLNGIESEIESISSFADLIELKNINKVNKISGAPTNLRIWESEVDEINSTGDLQLFELIQSKVNVIKGTFAMVNIFGSSINKKFEPLNVSSVTTSKYFDIPSIFKLFNISSDVSVINIQDTHIDLLFLKKINIIQQFRICRSRIIEEVNLESLNISKTTNSEMIDVDLTKPKLKFNDANFGKTTFVNVRWNRKYSLYDYSNERKMQNLAGKFNILWSLKEAYRQLKVLSLDQYNKIDAMYFQKHEIKCYYQIIEQRLFNEFSFPNFFDWIILWTNRMFSDFGLSWFRPLFSWLFIHGILFIFLLEYCDLGLRFSPLSCNIEDTFTGAKLYLELLFPIHSREFQNVQTGKNVPIWGFIDIAMRIIAPYFIYYIIRGTRKFNVGI